jgi:hypothetical protein
LPGQVLHAACLGGREKDSDTTRRKEGLRSSSEVKRNSTQAIQIPRSSAQTKEELVRAVGEKMQKQEGGVEQAKTTEDSNLF